MNPRLAQTLDKLLRKHRHTFDIIKSQKSFQNENKRMWIWNPQKPAKQDRNDTTTHLHHPYILYHFANYAVCLLVVCISGLWKAVGMVLLGV